MRGVLLLVPVLAWAVPPPAETPSGSVPSVQPASDEGQKAIARFRLSPGFANVEVFALSGGRGSFAERCLRANVLRPRRSYRWRLHERVRLFRAIVRDRRT